MKRFLLLAALCCLALKTPPTLDAASGFDSKFDVVLRGLRTASPQRLARVAKRRPVDAFTRIVHVLILLESGTTKETLAKAAPSLRVGTMSGAVATARVSLDELDALAALPGVRKIVLSRKYHLVNNIVRSSATFNGLYLGVLASAAPGGLNGYSGAGVIIGDVDTGIDYRHPDFVNGVSGNGYGFSSASTSRLLFYWDQTINAGSAPNIHCAPDSLDSGTNCDGYGTEWTQAQMTADLRNAACVAASGSNANATNAASNSAACTVKSEDTQGHGTAVMGSAAGNGLGTNGQETSGKYAGIASGASLIMVESSLLDSDICDGVNYIFTRALVLGAPAVANLSLGGQIGPHDGTAYLEECLQGLEAPGRLIVAAAGNSGTSTAPQHDKATVPANGSVAFTLAYTADESDVDFWHDGGDAYTVTVTDLSTSQSVTVTPGDSVGVSAPGVGVDNDLDPPDSGVGLNGAKEIFFDMTDAGPDPFQFTFQRVANGGTGRLDGWVDGEDSDYFTDASADNQETVGIPATSAKILAAGAYVSKIAWTDNNGDPQLNPFTSTLGAIAPFSSLGPTRDGRTKPDLAAPGSAIVTSLSQNAAVCNSGACDYDNVEPNDDISQDTFHAAINGTSFASPITAGAVALRLQQDPRLTEAQALSGLQGVARSDARASALPNNTWGSGKLLATPSASGPSFNSAIAVQAYPDPVYASRGQVMNFIQAPSGATLTIYAITGVQVPKLTADSGGNAVWNARNDAGAEVASGVYIVAIKGGGSTALMKVMVER